MFCQPCLVHPFVLTFSLFHTHLKYTKHKEQDDRHNKGQYKNPALLLSDALLVLNRLVDIHVGFFHIIASLLDLKFNLIEQLSLLLRQQCEIQKHLMQLRDTGFQRQNVLVLARHLRVRCLDLIIDAASQDSLLVQCVTATFALHDGIDLLIGGIGLDDLDLPFHLAFDIRLVLLLRSLVQLHLVDELSCQCCAQVLADSYVRSIDLLLVFQFPSFFLQQSQQRLGLLRTFIRAFHQRP
mmetsp:Transcript_757/g.1814  ORF Transcript_757/g.1814 Transcript_757/m.1814 type:complete len:239 (+) Transcript_757:1196-1912(+)